MSALDGQKQDKRRRLGSRRRFCVFDVSMPGQAADKAHSANAIIKCFSDEGEAWEVYKPCDGNWPAEDRKFEAIIVAGISSGASNADEENWFVLLRAYLHCLHKRQKLIFGCGSGAQIVAQALGGKTTASRVDQESGVVRCSPTQALANMWYADGACPFPSKLEIHQTHHDQVTELPDKAEAFFSSAKNAIEGFGIGDTVLCIQGHPEWNEYKTYTDSALLDQEHDSPRGTKMMAHSSFTGMCKRFLKTPSSMRWSGWSIVRYDVDV